MNDIKKYLKIAKDAVVEPKDRFEDKIIDRISHIEEKDKEEFLDDNFRDFFKKSNSKPYLLEQKIRTNPGVFTLISIMLMGIIALLAYFVRIILIEENR